MKDRSRFSTSAYAFAAASILAACGDGDETSAVAVAEPPSVPPPPPASVSTVVRGTITGFGSVIVDGTRIGVDGATLYSVEDGAEVTGDQSGLRIGMQVTVRGETNSSDETTADRIEAEVQLRGLAIQPMVLGSDPATGLFTVAGQEVLVDADTVFDEDIGNNDGVEGIDVRDLDPAFLPGNTPLVVEVSGLPTDFGVVATRVEEMIR